jgi:hypothetical protein
MKIIDLRVRWNEGWGNSPSWDVLVDSYPEFFHQHTRVWEGPRGGACWRAEIGDAVSYLSHNNDGRNHGGFGGQTYHLYLKGSGKKVSLGGPFSGNAQWCNEHWRDRDACVEVSYKDQVLGKPHSRRGEYDPTDAARDPWDQRSTYSCFCSGNIKVSAILEFLRSKKFIVGQWKGGGYKEKAKLVTGRIRVGWLAYGTVGGDLDASQMAVVAHGAASKVALHFYPFYENGKLKNSDMQLAKELT